MEMEVKQRLKNNTDGCADEYIRLAKLQYSAVEITEILGFDLQSVNTVQQHMQLRNIRISNFPSVRLMSQLRAIHILHEIMLDCDLKSSLDGEDEFMDKMRCVHQGCIFQFTRDGRGKPYGCIHTPDVALRFFYRTAQYPDTSAEYLQDRTRYWLGSIKSYYFIPKISPFKWRHYLQIYGRKR